MAVIFSKNRNPIVVFLIYINNIHKASKELRFYLVISLYHYDTTESHEMRMHVADQCALRFRWKVQL